MRLLAPGPVQSMAGTGQGYERPQNAVLSYGISKLKT